MRQILSLSLIMALGALVGCTQERITGDPKSIDIQHPLADVAVVPNPTVVGPIAATAVPGDPSHAYPFFSSVVDLAARGYVEEEFFIEGTANRYTLPDRATATMAATHIEPA